MSIRQEEIRSLYRSRPAIGPAGTAHGPAVGIKPSAVPPTGGYVVVSRREQKNAIKQMKDDKMYDHITLEPSLLRRSIFRVKARTPKSDNTERYFYPDPEKLWRWLQKDVSKGRMPETNEPIWFEDWWALYYTYGAPYVPQWAYGLPKLNEETASSAKPRNDPFAQPIDDPFALTPNLYGYHYYRDETTRMRLELERLTIMMDPMRRSVDSSIPEATGIIGRVWLHGGQLGNPSEQIFRYKMWNGLKALSLRGYRNNWADSVAVTAYSPDPEARRPNNAYTVYEYELLGLADDYGNAFLDFVRYNAGNTQEGVHVFFKDLLELSHTPIVMPRDLPAWAESASRDLVAPDLTVSDYEQWSQLVAAEREAHGIDSRR